MDVDMVTKCWQIWLKTKILDAASSRGHKMTVRIQGRNKISIPGSEWAKLFSFDLFSWGKHYLLLLISKVSLLSPSRYLMGQAGAVI